ncbi:MAG: DUF5683 domain-containing protein [Bacteroidota bacterium]
MTKTLGFLLVFLLFACIGFSQEEIKRTSNADSLQIDLKERGIDVESVVKKKINPLAPSKAAFYSAILPGLGQIYNRRYWKVPIVYGAIGTGVAVYIFNNNEYNRFRDAFKRRRAGFTDDEFFDLTPNNGVTPTTADFSDAALQDAQERFQRDRDLALLITIALYALNIIDANVDQHLKQFNVDDDLGFKLDVKPFLDYNPVTANPNYGMSFTIKF